MSGVLKDFLKILNMSKNIPIAIPLMVKINNEYNCIATVLSKFFTFYLNILPSNPDDFLSKSFSL